MRFGIESIQDTSWFQDSEALKFKAKKSVGLWSHTLINFFMSTMCLALRGHSDGQNRKGSIPVEV